ncbi:carbon-nitrogen hydrolase family protein [Paenibacillus mesophilus]|uniref:carbon-nitrogen hydrolase family protein n=1 Tax=Paenibacillus mesophilus TaxID=2582849 RepID=UPI00110E9681|nr:carbon-nitrogen hydrolase family protein [Paenibacillus mesophilus]TMV52832.1 carbon-nitrogen hydrolase family protein [Paenibacillus mesophilus]
MANYVKISSLGPAPCVIEASVPAEEAVGKMIAHWNRMLNFVLPDKPDLIVMPEACDRPSKMHYPKEQRMEYYRVRGNRIRDFFSEVAARHGCYIVYPSHMQAEDGSWRNTAQLIDRQGKVAGIYHKNHLVPAEYDANGILYGKDAPVFECDFGRVGFAICFDLNFDELRLKYVKEKPDLIVFPSMYHGALMQNYWAYSCRSHFVGSIAGLPCSIISPLGETVAQSTNYYPYITATVNLDSAVFHIDENGRHFAAIKQKYGAKVKIHDPGLLGSVLISSETDEFSVRHVIDEYKLELLDEYFSRALTHRCAPGHMEP